MTNDKMANLNDKTPILKIDHANLIRLKVGGKLTAPHKVELQKWADKVYATVLDLYKHTGQKVNFLTDLTQLEVIDTDCMDVYADLLKKDLPFVEKSATFGSSVVILAAFSTLAVISGRPNFRHFATREQAMDWLME